MVDTKVNTAGVYAVKFQVNGATAIVHVDDYVPVTFKTVKNASGNLV